MTNELLTVENLNVSFSGTRVVNDLSFTVQEGETIAIVGESGSGKSVTAMSLMGLLQEEDPGAIEVSGRALFRLGSEAHVDLFGLELAKLRRIRGREISMIFQEPMVSLNPVMTVGDQIGETLVIHEGLSRKAAQRAAIEMMELVRIPDSARRVRQYPHELSGGMRQRVMIAMAMIFKPRLLIADEPTTALDVTIQAQILDLISALQAEFNTAVLLITHDMGVVAETADRVLVMEKSRKIEEGDVFSIFENPQQPYTQKLLDAVPTLGSMSGTDLPSRFGVEASC